MLERCALRLGAVACLLVLPACGDFFDRLGNSDQRYFEISPAASLARGGWLTYTVRDYEVGGPNRAGISFQILDVTNDAAAHIQSADTVADLVVQGLTEGRSHVDFRAVADGKATDDGFTLTVTEVASLGFSTCHDAGGVYVRGTDGPVLYTFNPGAYPPVKGLGLYPFTLSPQDAVTLRTDASTDQRWVFSIPAEAPSTVVLASTLPGDDAQFILNIIDASAIDGIYATGSTGGTEGETTPINIMPSAAGSPVCIRTPRMVTSRTPSVCKLVSDSGDVTSLVTDEDTAELHFVAAGACTLTLEIGTLGVSAALSTLTVSQPSSGHHHFDD
jgi:hypothetical protein